MSGACRALAVFANRPSPTLPLCAHTVTVAGCGEEWGIRVPAPTRYGLQRPQASVQTPPMQ